MAKPSGQLRVLGWEERKKQSKSIRLPSHMHHLFICKVHTEHLLSAGKCKAWGPSCAPNRGKLCSSGANSQAPGFTRSSMHPVTWRSCRNNDWTPSQSFWFCRSERGLRIAFLTSFPVRLSCWPWDHPWSNADSSLHTQKIELAIVKGLGPVGGSGSELTGTSEKTRWTGPSSSLWHGAKTEYLFSPVYWNV